MRAADKDLPENHPGPLPQGAVSQWIDFASVEAGSGRKDGKDKGKGKGSMVPEKVCLPKVIEHDEEACGQKGIGWQRQDVLEEARKPKALSRNGSQRLGRRGSAANLP